MIEEWSNPSSPSEAPPRQFSLEFSKSARSLHNRNITMLSDNVAQLWASPQIKVRDDRRHYRLGHSLGLRKLPGQAPGEFARGNCRGTTPHGPTHSKRGRV